MRSTRPGLSQVVPCFRSAGTGARIGLIAALCSLSLSASSAADWPLTGSLRAHDPSIIKEAAKWWVFSTGAGAQIKSSSDGLNWQQEAPLFPEELSWWRPYAPKMKPRDIWAPDIHHFGDRIYCYYCVSEFGKNNSAIGLATCTDLDKRDWKDEGVVISSKQGTDAYNAIDPNLTIDANGKPWLVFGSWFDGIHLIALDSKTMKPTGKLETLAKREHGIEAPSLVYSNGYYHLFVSIDRCCQGVNSTYKIVYGRSTEIAGPYIDKTGAPLLQGGGTLLETGGSRWKGPGGETVYQTPKGWIIVRHAYDAEEHGTPKLQISDLRWDDQFWPTYVTP